MTIIAWDGITLAADKLGDSGGLRRTTTKIRRLPNGELFGSCGSASGGAHMFEWISRGANPEDVPAIQLTEEYQGVIVIRLNGNPIIYAKGAYPFEMEDPFYALGSGRDFAIAAMYLGCDAKKAVEIACLFEVNCGNGIDVLDFHK